MLAGLTVKLVLDVMLPGFKVYVLAPEGVITADEPGQILLLLTEVKPMVGVGLTVIGIISASDEALVQPVTLFVPLIV